MGTSVVMLATLALTLAQGQEPSPKLRSFLQQQIGLDSTQIAAAERGEAVVKVLESPEQRDVALFGIVAIGASRQAYLDQARDFSTALHGPNRTRFGIFHDPATAADVAAVVVNRDDIDGLKKCRPGDCVSKLPATDMERLQADVDWSAANLQDTLSALARRALVEYVTAYRASGDSAMVVYDDRARQNVHARDVFAALLASSPYLYQTIPSLQRYFAGYPRASLPGTAEVVYWAEDASPHLRPILSVTHRVVYTPQELPDVGVIASKQIYANHYFESMLDVTCVLDRSGAGGSPEGSWLLVLRRYRFDNLPSGGIKNIKGRATGSMRDMLTTELKQLGVGR
jgi:hypothetical protein